MAKRKIAEACNPGLDPKEMYKLICENKFDELNTSIKATNDKIDIQVQIIGKIREKVFDGFGAEIKALDKKVDAEKIANAKAHKENRRNQVWLLRFGVTTLVLIVLTLLGFVLDAFVFSKRYDLRGRPIAIERVEAVDALNIESP